MKFNCLFTAIFLILCRSALAQQTGDIAADPTIDDPAFTVCDSQRVFQYYNTASYYKDHKKEIARYFFHHYKAATGATGQDGYITIRFIINCTGATGRFRLYQLDSNYHPFRFHEAISAQLLSLVKRLKGWKPAAYRDKTFDSYQYITFTIKKGRIACITP
jgi:hypothetical protein